MAQSTPEAVGKAVERVYDARDYQTEMPQEEPVQVFKPLVIPDIVKEIIRIVLITLLVVGGLLLLFFLVNALPTISERFKRRAAGPAIRSAPRRSPPTPIASAWRLR